jgi:transposase, IS5 family
VADSISWLRFCRIPLGTRLPHPTTLTKITSRCGDDAVAALNEVIAQTGALAGKTRQQRRRMKSHCRPEKAHTRPIT